MVFAVVYILLGVFFMQRSLQQAYAVRKAHPVKFVRNCVVFVLIWPYVVAMSIISLHRRGVFKEIIEKHMKRMREERENESKDATTTSEDETGATNDETK